MLFLSFLASLSPLAFSRPMYIFVGPVTHYSYRLGLMGFFAIYPVNSLWSSSLGSFVYWASTNGPQHLAPWTYETFLRFICEWKGASALLSSSFFFSFFAGLFFFKLWTPFLFIHISSFLPRTGLSLRISQFGSYFQNRAAASLTPFLSNDWPFTSFRADINDLGI